MALLQYDYNDDEGLILPDQTSKTMHEELGFSAQESQAAEFGSTLTVEQKAERIKNETAAIFRMKNNAIGFFNSVVNRGIRNPDPNFNLGDSLNSLSEEYQAYRDSYLWCQSQRDIDAQTYKLNQEFADQKILHDTGLFEGLIPSLMAAVTDPSNIVSAQAGLALSNTVSHPILKARAFLVGFGATNATIMKAWKDTMSWADAGIRTAIGEAIGTALKGMGFYITEKFKNNMVKEVSSILQGTGTSYEYAGQDKVRVLDPTVGLDAVVKMPGWFKELYRATPKGKAETSPFNIINKVGRMWLRVDYPTKATDMEVSEGASVESLIEYYKGTQFNTRTELVNNLNKYVTAKKGDGEKFSIELRKAILNGGHHFDSEVQESARTIRERFNKLNEEAFELKLSSVSDPNAPVKQGVYDKKDNFVEAPYLTKAESEIPADQLRQNFRKDIVDREDIYYLPRTWNVQACVSNRNQLIDLFTKANLKQQSVTKGKYSIKAAEAKAEKQYDHIIGASEGEKTYIEGITSIGKFNKTQSVLIDDEILSDFLITDPIQILHSYENKVIPAIIEKKVLEANGFGSIKKLESILDAEYQEMKKAPNVNMEKLLEEKTEAENLLRDIPALVKGTFSAESTRNNPNLAAFIYAVKQYNYSRHMGSLLLSSLDNPANIVHRWGLTNTCKAFLRTFTNSFGEIGKLTARQRRDLNFMGVALELRSANLSDDLDRIGSEVVNYRTKYELDTAVNATRTMARMNSKWSGSAWWKDFNKHIAGDMFMNEVLSICEKGTANLTIAERKFLGESRIPVKMADAIKEQFELYGNTYKGLRMPNFNRWTDEAAKETFGAAVVTNSNNTILIPGVGSVPFWFRKLPGRMLVSYYNYMFAYTNNILRDFATGRAKHKVATITTQVGMTALGEYIKAYSRNDPYLGVDDKELWTNTFKRLPVLSWAGQLGETLLDVHHAYTTGGKRKAVEETLKMSPSLEALWDIFLDTPYGLNFDNDGAPMSEYKLKRKFGLAPLITHPFIQFTMTRAVNSYVNHSGGQLSKTREQRYMDER